MPVRHESSVAATSTNARQVSPAGHRWDLLLSWRPSQVLSLSPSELKGPLVKCKERLLMLMRPFVILIPLSHWYLCILQSNQMLNFAPRVFQLDVTSCMSNGDVKSDFL